MLDQKGNLRAFAIILILIIAAVHGFDAKDSFDDAIYKGWLFYANALGCLAAAYGIYQSKSWGWNLAVAIAVMSFTGYVLSRTVGLPLIPAEPDEWLEPLGVVSLIAEALFVAVYVKHKVPKN